MVSYDVGSKRNDFLETFGTQLSRNRPKHASALGQQIPSNDHTGVVVEADTASILTSCEGFHADNHCALHGLLPHGPAGGSVLHGNHNNVSNVRVPPPGAAEHFNTLNTLRTRVICHIEIALHLNHDCLWEDSSGAFPFFFSGSGGAIFSRCITFSTSASVMTSSTSTAFLTISSTLKCLRLLRGRHSPITTRSPSCT